MKTIAYIPLHYGAEYLHYSIKSINDFVDKILIFYTEQPSYGHGTTAKCPDNELQLKSIAEGASNKIEWIKGRWGSEGQHRSEIFSRCKGYNLILTIDSDEVWDDRVLGETIENVMRSKATQFGVNGFRHFWRSFDTELIDWFRPIRFYKPAFVRNNMYEEIKSQIYHFGYCQSEAIMRYKWTCHGHQDELKSGYLDNVFYKWTQIGTGWNLHPSSNDVWKDNGDLVRHFDKESMPNLLKGHPYFNQILI